jgi:poly-gamma-glutamate synthesis protein (capsule biosynthesis protein)
VFPHWGAEYRYSPFQNQQRLARQIIDAGADMIIGNHAHYAAAVEVYKGKPIWYALGNFVFDQTWSEPTMEGISLELTFQGAELQQIRMRPHIILDKAQPNFMDPAKDGRFVLGPIYDASKGLLPY